MASKKSSSKATKGMWQWKGLFVSASVTLNIAFVVVFIAIISTSALDIMVMKEGLNRYCSTANDLKFEDSTAKTQALREFTCARGDAADDFEAALNAYLKTKDIDIAE